MNPDLQLVRIEQAVELSRRIESGIVLDRAETKKLLRQLEKLDSAIVGCEVMQGQLRSILDRRDWVTISIEAASPEAVRTTGITIGIVQAKFQPLKTRRSPLQKWQRRNGLGRRS